MFEEDLFFGDKIPTTVMEDPFFHTYHPYSFSSQPRRPPSQPSHPSPSARPRKVFSIPVHHVESEKRRSESATKIQKVFRGFRVRKTVKKIMELEREVDDVQKKLFEGETMAVIRRNGLEKLKVTEALMAILFKLDSVRGINCGVRELRKAVITKAITLQEIVDAAISDEILESSNVTDMNIDESTENIDDSRETLEKIGAETLVEFSEVNEMENLDDSSKISEKIGSESETLGEDIEVNQNESFDDSCKMQVENSEEINSEITNSEKICNEIGTETLEQIKDGDNGEGWECIAYGIEEKKSDFNNGDLENCGIKRNSGKESVKEDWYVIEGGNNGGQEKEKEKKKKEKLLEKMVEDNQRLIAMVADLCQKNNAQANLICSLSQRVEQLEKAMNDRLNKKKKKKCNASHL